MLPASTALSAKSPQMILKFMGQGGKNTIVVSKSVAKKAVERNRIKRITKEAIRSMKDMPSGYTVIIRENIAGLKTPQIKEILEKLL